MKVHWKYVFFILNVYFIAKADNSNSRFLAKRDNSTFHVLELKKKTLHNLCNLLRWQCRCLANIVVVIINCMDVITQSISLHCNALFLQGSMKTSQLLFSFFTLKKISQVHQVCRNDPSSITFSQLWWNSSQLARLFKVKVAMSPDQNTACWYFLMRSTWIQIRLNSRHISHQKGYLFSIKMKKIIEKFKITCLTVYWLGLVVVRALLY